MHRIITGSAAAAAALAIAAGTGAAAKTPPSSPLVGDATRLTTDVGRDSAQAVADSRAAAQQAVGYLRADVRATIRRARAQLRGTVRSTRTTVDGTVRGARTTVDQTAARVGSAYRSLTLTAFAVVDSTGRVVAAPGAAAVTSGPLGAWIVTWRTSMRGCAQVALANSVTGGTLRLSHVSPMGVTVLGRSATEGLDGSGFTVAAFC